MTPDQMLTQAQLEHEIDRFQKDVTPSLDAWLASFEGKRFESKEAGQIGIDEIVRTVRRAGRKVLCKGEPVSLAVACGTGQRVPSIRAVTSRTGKRAVLCNSVEFPLLTSGDL